MRNENTVNTDESPQFNIGQRKPDTKKYILYSSMKFKNRKTHLWFQKSGQRSPWGWQGCQGSAGPRQYFISWSVSWFPRCIYFVKSNEALWLGFLHITPWILYFNKTGLQEDCWSEVEDKIAVRPVGLLVRTLHESRWGACNDTVVCWLKALGLEPRTRSEPLLFSSQLCKQQKEQQTR